MLFTDKGRCYWLKVFEIPEAGRAARGKSIANLIAKEAEESIASYVTVKNFEDPFFVMMVTQNGTIKKTGLTEYSNPRRTGIVAIGLAKGDRLIDVRLTDGSQDVVIGTREGLAIRFHEQEVRAMGRNAAGVRAMKLQKNDQVVGAVALRRTGTTILVATEGGYGKRSETSEYRVSHRGGKGIITVKTTAKTGKMVAIKEVVEKDDVVVVTSGGIVIRQHASEIRLAGRNTQGVRLIKLGEGDTIADVAAVVADEDEDAVEGGNRDGTPENGSGKQEDLFTGEKKKGAIAPKKAGPPKTVKPEAASERTKKNIRTASKRRKQVPARPGRHQKSSPRPRRKK
jgi:DNA gyrase subunit A